jgi:hypothetical protein
MAKLSRVGADCWYIKLCVMMRSSRRKSGGSTMAANGNAGSLLMARLMPLNACTPGWGHGEEGVTV